MLITKSDDVEFSFSFSQSGIEVTLTGKLHPEVLASFEDSVSDRDEWLSELSMLALPQAAGPAIQALQEFHCSIALALRLAVGKVSLSRAASQ